MNNGSNNQRGGEQGTKKEYAVTHFLELRKNKGSIEEIAKACNVSCAFMYSYIIPEVSQRFGIPKDELLYQPHSPAVYTTKPGRKKGTKVSQNSNATDVVETITEAPSTIEEQAATEKQEDTTTSANTAPVTGLLKEILDNLNIARKIIQEATA